MNSHFKEISLLGGGWLVIKTPKGVVLTSFLSILEIPLHMLTFHLSCDTPLFRICGPLYLLFLLLKCPLPLSLASLKFQ